MTLQPLWDGLLECWRWRDAGGYHHATDERPPLPDLPCHEQPDRDGRPCPSCAPRLALVVGCGRCNRWTRVVPGTDGMRYPYHKPGCPHEGEWVEARRALIDPIADAEPFGRAANP